MKTDVLLIPMGETYAQMRSAGLMVERAGFDGIWTWDHLRDPEDDGSSVPECWTTLTALAEVVPRVTLGPLVLNVANHDPGVLANMAATLQQVSGGRLLLGIGAGGSLRTPYAREQIGIGRAVHPDGLRRQHVIEAVQVLRRLWSGDTSDFDGSHYQLRRPSGYLRPDPPPPIVVGGFGPRMAAVAGRYGDGLNTQAFHPQLPSLIEIARREREETGRDPNDLLITVFAGMGARWLQRDSPDRSTLLQLGVSRLILLLEPPFDVPKLETSRQRS